MTFVPQLWTVHCAVVHAARLSLSDLWSLLHVWENEYTHLFSPSLRWMIPIDPNRNANTLCVSWICLESSRMVNSVLQCALCFPFCHLRLQPTKSPFIQPVATDSDLVLRYFFLSCHCCNIGSINCCVFQFWILVSPM